MPYIIGLDIGGTKCAVLLAYIQNGIDIKDKIKFDTETHKGFEYTKERLIKAIYEIIDRNELTEADINAVGISCGGPLDSKRGLVLSPPNLPGWNNINIVEIIQQEFKVPAFLQNDANACALVEWKMGAGMNSDNMIFLTMGTGLGAGIISDGGLIIGANDMAGEVGHVRLEDNGPEGYGKEGSFEGFCSGGGIARLAQGYVSQLLEQGKKVDFCPAIEKIQYITAKLVADSAKSGDETALEIFRQVGEKLGKGIAALIDILNPDTIVIGSIFGRSEELLRPHMEKIIDEEALIQSRGICKIVAAKTGESIGDYASIMVGAYGLNIDLTSHMEEDSEVLSHFEKLFERHPDLIQIKDSLMKAYEVIISTYNKGGKLLICGNGGSAADSEHIVGELMKGFLKKRKINEVFRSRLLNVAGKKGLEMADTLQSALPAIALTQHSALSTAYCNDVTAEMVFAQQVFGYGNNNDTLIAISASGNSRNIINAVLTAKAKGIKVITLTGRTGGGLKSISDIVINAPSDSIPIIQEYHLPIYHTLCAMVEEKFFRGD